MKFQENQEKKSQIRSVAHQIVQKKSNHTGLPDNLKSGIESLSGHSMDDVKVHYNSSRPAQLHAHAFAQGNQIHLGPGQEKHLPHEAWHVVQQKQGRVKPTMQLKSSVSVNDDPALENDADVMGKRASQHDEVKKNHQLINTPTNSKIRQFGFFEWFKTTKKANDNNKDADDRATSENFNSAIISAMASLVLYFTEATSALATAVNIKVFKPEYDNGESTANKFNASLVDQSINKTVAIIHRIQENVTKGLPVTENATQVQEQLQIWKKQKTELSLSLNKESEENNKFILEIAVVVFILIIVYILARLLASIMKARAGEAEPHLTDRFLAKKEHEKDLIVTIGSSLKEAKAGAQQLNSKRRSLQVSDDGSSSSDDSFTLE